MINTVMLTLHIFIVLNSSCGKLMFLQNCVKNSAHRGRGVYTPRQTPPRRPLQWTVRILLECILVTCCHFYMGGISGPMSFTGEEYPEPGRRGGWVLTPLPIHGTWDSMRYCRQAGDAYPTGMLSCIISFSW